MVWQPTQSVFPGMESGMKVAKDDPKGYKVGKIVNG